MVSGSTRSKWQAAWPDRCLVMHPRRFACPFDLPAERDARPCSFSPMEKESRLERLDTCYLCHQLKQLTQSFSLARG
jgi:hypothetical protein